MGASQVIPSLMHIALPYSFLWGFVSIIMTSIFLMFVLLILAFATHAGRIFYISFFMLFIPTSVLGIFLPVITNASYTPFLQGALSLPLLALWPLAKLQTLPEAWGPTAHELGANRSTCLRLIIWPLLKKPLFTSFFLSLFFGIAQ